MLDVWPREGADTDFEGAMFEFRATTQLGAVRKAKKALKELTYEGTLKGELCVSVEDSEADPVPIMTVLRDFWYDNLKFTPL